jgi:putative flavoprotein involved in K+ transport
VLLERGRVAERWRSERWDSLRLLTPNWMTRLPDHGYRGPDPKGFMTAADVVALLSGYAEAIAAPVEPETSVLRVAPADGGFRIETDRGPWCARAVVVATGACDRPAAPGWAAALPARLHQVAAPDYRRPALLPPGGVLIVGASATGVQIARELQASGRQVTLSVGRHTRMPRRYRGRDIMEWLDAAGILDEPASPQSDGTTVRAQPSLQLTGRRAPDPHLAALAAEGVRVTGRAVGTDGRRVLLRADLAQECAASDVRLRRVLGKIDAYAGGAGDAWREPVHPTSDLREIDLAAEGIATVLWATGYRRDYRWLPPAALDPGGEIRHRGGVSPVPGLFALGLPFQRRRNSTFIDGVGRDAAEIARSVADHLAGPRAARAA